MKKNHVVLKEEDRQTLRTMLDKGSLKSRTYKKMMALLELDKGKTYAEVEATVQLSRVSLGKLARRYALSGLDSLHNRPRPGRPVRIGAQQREQIAQLAAEEAPDGHSQWSLRLLADKAVELGYCDSISHTQVKNILKKKKSGRT